MFEYFYGELWGRLGKVGETSYATNEMKPICFAGARKRSTNMAAPMVQHQSHLKYNILPF